MKSRSFESSKIHQTAYIAPDVSIGVECEIGFCAYLGEGTILGSRVKIGAHVVVAERVTNSAPQTIVSDGVIIESGATICSGVEIHSGATIRAGTVVNRNTPPGAVLEGNPAKIVGYNNTTVSRSIESAFPRQSRHFSTEHTPVSGVQIFHFPLITDLRGNLTVGEFEKEIPFLPERFFMVFDVANQEIRGEHAHLKCHQFLICVRGRCSVVADDGTRRVEVQLDRPNQGVYLPPMIWGTQYNHSSDAVLLVFASHTYDPNDYIRTYSDFLNLKRNKPQNSSY